MRARLDESLDIDGNPSLFGTDRQPGLVSLSADRHGRLLAYRRAPGGALSREEVSFRPFLWLSELDVLRGLEGVEVETTELAGSNFYRYLVQAQSWPELKTVSEHIARVSGQYASHPESPQLYLNDPATGYLLSSGRTFFNSMAIEEVVTLFLRVYTRGQVLDDPGPEPQAIHAVALQLGPDGELHLLEGEDEAQILWRLTGNVKKLDPDVIVGHTLFKSDLEAVNRRCKALKVKLDWGRDGERLSNRRARMTVAEKQLDYQRFSAPGRELCDTWILSVLHDVSGREMSGFELADVADHFELEYGGPGDNLAVRASKDMTAVSTLYRSLAYPYFLQAQIFPLTYESVMWRGNATRINYLFLREYYRRGHSVPGKPEVVPFAGGLTAQDHEGCAYGVYHCDVASLYPSLILAYDLSPEGDELQIFKGMLKDLRHFRLLAKEKQKTATSEGDRRFFNGLQNTFKILINSFYGYLGFGQGHFADYAKAAEVTRLGRQLLTRMMDWLKGKGARILEVDTDGIYFVPSAEFATAAWIQELDAQFPAGVSVEFDGRYRGMYCHKMKNYALLEEDGTLLLRGSGLRSRALEPFLRNFIEDLIRQTLALGPGQGERVFAAYQERLEKGQMSVYELAKNESLIDSPAAYAKKIEKGARNRAAVYEIALKADRKYQAGDSISYYVTGEKATVTVYDHCKRVAELDPEQPDVNVKYYKKKLKDTYKKFAPVLDADPLRSAIAFEQLPRPTH
jgi:DNA polymerase elongation subunit (family B)